MLSRASIRKCSLRKWFKAWFFTTVIRKERTFFTSSVFIVVHKVIIASEAMSLDSISS